jgi:uncharacterized protein (DUF302 family)
MSAFTLATTVPHPFEDVLDATRAALSEQGFGVLTEIDLAATLRAKLGVDLPPQVVLGACRPELAHQALLADPSIAAVLPCNVVVRAVDETTTTVEAFDPDVMLGLADSEALRPVAADARVRLDAVLEAVARA